MDAEKILQEIQLKAIRSSGPGGQHVNKTATKIELTFNVVHSGGLDDAEKQRLQEKLSSRLTAEGTLMVYCDETRSQYRNKKKAMDRLLALLQENLKVPKPRKKTKPSKTAIQKRLDTKKKQTLKKSLRKPPDVG